MGPDPDHRLALQVERTHVEGHRLGGERAGAHDHTQAVEHRAQLGKHRCRRGVVDRNRDATTGGELFDLVDEAVVVGVEDRFETVTTEDLALPLFARTRDDASAQRLRHEGGDESEPGRRRRHHHPVTFPESGDPELSDRDRAAQGKGRRLLIANRWRDATHDFGRH